MDIFRSESDFCFFPKCNENFSRTPPRMSEPTRSDVKGLAGLSGTGLQGLFMAGGLALEDDALLQGEALAGDFSGLGVASSEHLDFFAGVSSEGGLGPPMACGSLTLLTWDGAGVDACTGEPSFTGTSSCMRTRHSQQWLDIRVSNLLK